MKDRRKASFTNIHESFSDMALLMLATFIFLFVLILITSRLAEEYETPQLKQQVEEMRRELQRSAADKDRLLRELDDMAGMSTEAQMQRALEVAQLATGQGRKDFEIFIAGLRNLPGDDLHLVVDATGSMHGLSSFLIPILRVIVIRSGKHLDAITWFSDENAGTYTGSMGEMFDQLVQWRAVHRRQRDHRRRLPQGRHERQGPGRLPAARRRALGRPHLLSRHPEPGVHPADRPLQPHHPVGISDPGGQDRRQDAAAQLQIKPGTKD
jgi:hypothetical protein